MPPKRDEKDGEGGPRSTMFCPFCGQGFGGQVSAYMRHMRSHYDRTPHLRVCHYCGYSPKVGKAAWGLDHRHQCKLKPVDQPARDERHVATPQKIREGLGCLFGFSEEAWRLNQHHDEEVVRGRNLRRGDKRRREREAAAAAKPKRKTPSAALGAPPPAPGPSAALGAPPPPPVPAQSPHPAPPPPPAPFPAPATPSSSSQKRKGKQPQRKRVAMIESDTDSDE